MNRRGFLGTLTMATALGTPTIADAGRAEPIEPRPTRFDFQPVYGGIDCDAAIMTVAAALGDLRWDSADAMKPLLVVHPSCYPYALAIVRDFNNRIAVWATPFSDDVDTWFVAWRGRRVGSQGA